MSHVLTPRLLPAAAALAGFLLVLVAAIAAGGLVRALVNCDVPSFSVSGEESVVIGEINAYRAQNDAPPLTQSTNLNRAAQWMANDMATKSYFSHTDSLGRPGYTRSMECGYPQGAGENLAAGAAWDTAAEAMVAWKGSPGHNQNMLLPFYQQIGVALVYLPGSVYGYYWVTEFGATHDGTDGTGGGAQQPTPTNTIAPATATATPTQVPFTATPEANVTQVAGPIITFPDAPTTTSTPSPQSGSRGPDATATSSGPGPVTSQRLTPTPRAATPAARPEGAAKIRINLGVGANLVTWPGRDTAPWLVANTSGGRITVIYTFDAQAGKWLRYSPALGGTLNTLDTLRPGTAYWVVTSGAVEIETP